MPTYINGVPLYMYGGRMKYATGGAYVDDSYADINAQAYGQTGVGATGETQGGGGLGTSGWMSIIESVQGIGDSIGTDTSTTEGKIGSVTSGITDPFSALEVWDTPGVSTHGKILGTVAPGYGKLQVDQNAKKEENMAKLAQNNKSIISNLPGQSSYIPTFKMGGEITDRVSSIDNGSSHEASPFGGVPIGQNSLLEKDEVIFTNKAGKKYVFSNKIFR